MATATGSHKAATMRKKAQHAECALAECLSVSLESMHDRARVHHRLDCVLDHIARLRAEAATLCPETAGITVGAVTISRGKVRFVGRR